MRGPKVPAVPAPRLRTCAVVIPARNEELSLARCLAAVDQARSFAAPRHPGMELITVLVLDSCTDASAQIAADFPDVEVVTTRQGNVGSTRHLGCLHALELAAAPPEACWLACTDADSTVPADWLSTMLDFAAAGSELVLGTITLAPEEFTAVTFDRFSAEYQQREGHPHVHGTNLGIRGDLYRRIGGFRPLVEHEDVRLVQAARNHGARVRATARIPVLTSSRLRGRTPGGFAGWLADRAQAG